MDKPILELLTFGSNLDFVDFLLKKLNFQAVIKSAATTVALTTQNSVWKKQNNKQHIKVVLLSSGSSTQIAKASQV